MKKKLNIVLKKNIKKYRVLKWLVLKWFILPQKSRRSRKGKLNGNLKAFWNYECAWKWETEKGDESPQGTKTIL